MEIAAVVVLSLILGFVVFFSLRVGVRYALRNWREKATGPMVWYRMVPEGRSSNTAATTESQRGAVATFINSLQKKGKYRDRPVCSVVWNKSQDDGMAHLYLGYTSDALRGNDSLVTTFASSINCRAMRVDGPPEINPHGGAIGVRGPLTPGQVTEYPKESGPVASVIGRSNISGSVVMTMEMFRRTSESRRFKTWLNADAELQQGASVTQSSAWLLQAASQATETGVRSTFAAFADSGEYSQSQAMLNTTMSSMNTSVNDFSVSRLSASENSAASKVWTTILGIAASALFMFLGLNVVVGSIFIVLFILAYALGSFPTIQSKLVDQRSMQGEVVVPSFWYVSLRYMVHSFFRRNYRADRDGNRNNNFFNAPPSQKNVFLSYATPITQFISVPSSATGSNVAADEVPRIAMNYNQRIDNGIWLGKDGDWGNVFLREKDLVHGGFVAGTQGSGKSNELMIMFAMAAKYAAMNPGKCNPAWADIKGDGAYKAYALVQNLGRSALVDCHNPAPGFRLALEGRRIVDGASVREVLQNAEALVSAMQYAFGDGIKSESRQGLDASISLALLLSEEEIQNMSLHHFVDPRYPNVIKLAWLALMGDPNYDPSQHMMAMFNGFSALMEKGEKLDEREMALYNAIAILSPQYDKKGSNRAAAERLAPPRNKLTELVRADTFWTHTSDRTPITISNMMEFMAPVVVNLGAYWDPTAANPDGTQGRYVSNFSTITSKYLIKMFNYAQWNYVKAYHSGWEEEGKSSPVFYDEVADISHNQGSEMSNVMEEGVKEGRSRGYGLWCATQYPSQLPPSAQNAVLNLRTKLWFNISLEADVNMAYRSLTFGEQTRDFPFSQSSFSKIKNGMSFAVLKSPTGESNTNVFTLITPDAMSLKPYLERETSPADAVRAFDLDGGTYTHSQERPPQDVLARTY